MQSTLLWLVVGQPWQPLPLKGWLRATRSRDDVSARCSVSWSASECPPWKLSSKWVICNFVLNILKVYVFQLLHFFTTSKTQKSNVFELLCQFLASFVQFPHYVCKGFAWQNCSQECNLSPNNWRPKFLKSWKLSLKSQTIWFETSPSGSAGCCVKV